MMPSPDISDIIGTGVALESGVGGSLIEISIAMALPSPLPPPASMEATEGVSPTFLSFSLSLSFAFVGAFRFYTQK
jgi:hypothetical protein